MMNFMTIRVDSPATGEPYNVYVPARMSGLGLAIDNMNYLIGGFCGDTTTSYGTQGQTFIKIPDAHPTRPSAFETTNWLNKMYTAANSPGAPMYGEPIPFDYPIEAVTIGNQNVAPPAPKATK